MMRQASATTIATSTAAPSEKCQAIKPASCALRPIWGMNSPTAYWAATSRNTSQCSSLGQRIIVLGHAMAPGGDLLRAMLANDWIIRCERI